jgi:hypothetical protein
MGKILLKLSTKNDNLKKGFQNVSKMEQIEQLNSITHDEKNKITS